MKLTAAIVALVVAAGLAVPRTIVRTRCLQATTSCFEDDLGSVCVADLHWVTRRGDADRGVVSSTCHEAWMRRWLGFEWFLGNIDGRQR